MMSRRRRRLVDCLRSELRLLGIALGLCASLTACKVTPVQPDPPDPTPATGGAGPVLSDCERAETRIRELNCCQVDGYRYDTCPDDDSGFPLWEVPAVAGEPVKSFVDACEYSLEQGRDWCAGALAEIANCGEIDAAMRSCE